MIPSSSHTWHRRSRLPIFWTHHAAAAMCPPFLVRSFLPLLFTALPFLVGCKSVGFYPEQRISTGFDFRPYTEKGFVFTPEGSVLGTYEPVGLLSFIYYPEARRVETDGGSRYHWVIGNIDPQIVLEFVYGRAQAMGADAIIRFEYSFVEKHVGTPGSNFTIPGIEVQGLAVKRSP